MVPPMSNSTPPRPVSTSALTLKRQLAELTKNPVEGFSAGLVDDSNFYEWEIMIIGPPDTLYEGGFFKARLTFPEQYPLLPPKMKFLSEMWHPSIYSDGNVCISILHDPGEDQWGYEHASERWSPVHTVTTILMSVISLLSCDPPDCNSPANVDAAKDVRENIQGSCLSDNVRSSPGKWALGYRKKVRRLARKSAEEAFD
ncbi:Ubiquitin-conjugating enzyme E2 15 [Leucoagaricus gongylophorus]